MRTNSQAGQYTLATGKAAVRRLHLLNDAYWPAGRRALLQAGLNPGMTIADFGCGVGATTRSLAHLTGPTGHVTGIDLSADQVEQGRQLAAAEALSNVTFMAASALATGLPRNSFDVVYCRFLLLHLTDPKACLREMRDVLKPGGIVLIEDGNLMTAGSTPPSALNHFSTLFGRLGPARKLNYALAEDLFHLVRDAGFPDPSIEIHQPALARGEARLLLKLSVEEIGPACIAEGVLEETQLATILAEMQRDTDDPNLVALMPRMSQVWARKPT